VTIDGRRYHDFHGRYARSAAFSNRKPCTRAAALQPSVGPGQTNDIAPARVDELLELVGLAGVARRRAGKFSSA